jgi:hypothetical protein
MLKNCLTPCGIIQIFLHFVVTGDQYPLRVGRWHKRFRITVVDLDALMTDDSLPIATVWIGTW